MKRKILMMLMTFTMSASILAGCSKDDPKVTQYDSISTDDVRDSIIESNNSGDAAEKTLTDYFAEPGVKEGMDSSVAYAKSSLSEYSDVSYEIDGNTLVYIYVFKNPVPKDTIEGIQEDLDAELSKSVKDQNLIGMLEQQSGVKGVSVQFIYRNPDGTDVFNGTYSE